VTARRKTAQGLEFMNSLVLDFGPRALCMQRTIMKARLFLLTSCFLAACEPVAPPDQAAVDAAPSRAGVAAPPAESAVESTEEPNPLLPLLEQDLPYGESEGGNLVGFLAMPEEAAEPLPGLLLFHEWWGLTVEIKTVARRLAREGYIVLATDFYGGRVAEDVAGAQALMTELVAAPERTRDNIRQAYEYLERYALSPRIGSIGWDMGGRWSLQTALMLPADLDAMVMFYGGVITDEEMLSTLSMPMLGFFGELDRSIPLREVQEFRGGLNRLGKQAEIRIYSGTDHAFFFPQSPTYAPLPADDAWTRLIAMLETTLQN
jgi:carboxymethylenebutenolidase